MIDPDEAAAYEVWKEQKLVASVDVSVKAFNDEMEMQARAYEQAVNLAKRTGTIREVDAAELLAENPYRRPGMTAHNRRIVSETAPLPDEKES